MTQELIQIIALAITITMGFIIGLIVRWLDNRKPVRKWTMQEDYMFLKANIEACESAEELKKFDSMINTFYYKYRNQKSKLEECRRYYLRLCQAILKRKSAIENILS